MFIFYSLIWLLTVVQIGYWFCFWFWFFSVKKTQSTKYRFLLSLLLLLFCWVFFMWYVFKYLSSPNSNFPGPFLRKLPLIHVGIVPLIVVGIASGVSSTEVTRAAMLSSPLACGQRCQLGTKNKLEESHVLHIYRNVLSRLLQIHSCGSMNIYSLGPLNRSSRGATLTWSKTQIIFQGVCNYSLCRIYVILYLFPPQCDDRKKLCGEMEQLLLWSQLIHPHTASTYVKSWPSWVIPSEWHLPFNTELPFIQWPLWIHYPVLLFVMAFVKYKWRNLSDQRWIGAGLQITC